MKAKGMKRVLTFALATTMVLGSTVSSFAAAGESEGAGTYEGGEMKYPTLAVTLPTIPEHTYDYIADPNGLIDMTDAAHYADSTFTGTTGIFFLTTPKTSEEGSKNLYTNKSAAQSVTNENAQDIDVTVKLEQKTAGSEGVVYSNAATFESTDTAKKIYLAVTDDAESNAKVSALSSTAAATVSATVFGKPGNYKPAYDSTNGYGYVLKTKTENGDKDLTWNSCSFILTGALNKNAEWGDSVTFPAIKVTWSYAEHQDGPSVVSTTGTMAEGENAVIALNLAGATVSKVEQYSAASSAYVELTKNTQWSVTGNNLTIDKSFINAVISAGVTSKKFKITFSTETSAEVTLSIAGD